MKQIKRLESVYSVNQRSKPTILNPTEMEKPGVCGGFVGKEDEDFGVNGGTDATDETQKPAFPNIFKFILMDIIISFYLPKA